jgi:hypothetical protein
MTLVNFQRSLHNSTEVQPWSYWDHVGKFLWLFILQLETSYSILPYYAKRIWLEISNLLKEKHIHFHVLCIARVMLMKHLFLKNE